MKKEHKEWQKGHKKWQKRGERSTLESAEIDS